jgi:ATP-dependent DNA helicase RecQ
VRKDIIHSLALKQPGIINVSPHRGNLAFQVAEVRGDARDSKLRELVQDLPRPGIVYCATIQSVEQIYKMLNYQKLPVHRYHGRMSAQQRTQQQQLFMDAKQPSIMVATSAFGLGIDKPDIRFVIHYQTPASLEQYVQEAGRAGRDGQMAQCELLYDPSDRLIHESLLQKSRVRPDQLYRLAKALTSWAKENRSPESLEALAVTAGLSQRITDALLAVLDEAGMTQKGPSGTIEILLSSAQLIDEQAKKLAGRFETVRIQDVRRLNSFSDYAHAHECRSIFLRRYFGEPDPQVCGLCDICKENLTRQKYVEHAA